MNHQIGLLVLPTINNIEEIIKGLSMPVLLTKGSYKMLEFRIKNNELSLIHNEVDIKNYENIWLSSSWNTRDVAYAANLYLERFNTPHTYVEKVTSKITDMVQFIINGITMPDTFFVDLPDISRYVHTIEAICGYPLIIKDIMGAAGANSLLIRNRDELLTKSRQLPKNSKFIYQKFIPNDYDWGILVANGEVVSGERSYPAKGEFRNNCNGAEEHFTALADIPVEIKNMALKAHSLLGLSWSRSDIVIDRTNQKAYLMEVNRCPGISTGTAEVAGARCFLEEQIRSHMYEQGLGYINGEDTKKEGTFVPSLI
jgi:glutathione synthase/RimK-type ligase-like ATP-grasp enzyme